ncbi:hypothetical protein CCR75_004877 [Bremia lactucae]|uniref:Renin receptor-like C-terminal transmembrane spanning segment domain-containing protein n=1 Tax=Bremia lactucae TaxID=4779 RepID=A0A976IIR0_BRELC|nr:hypothetical protein CCR75_004877 [Bremia lactucae]
MRSSFLLSLATLVVSDASTDKILILGMSSSPLWHESRPSSPFSAAGMVDLALDSLGLMTGQISTRSSVPSPLQADLFTHSEMYALILLDETHSFSSMEAVNAALDGTQAFHKIYPAQTASAKVPVTVAQLFELEHASAIHCAGDRTLCASVNAQTPQVQEKVVQQVLEANSYLSQSHEEEVAFATQLAQIIQLKSELKYMQGTKLLLVGIKELQGDKQNLAQQAVTTTVAEFVAELVKNKQAVAAQIMTGTFPTVLQQTAALSRNRKLVTNDEEVEEEEKSGDEDEDGTADSGSESLDGSKSSLTNTSTLSGAVSMADIAEFQIILWTSVLLVAILLMAIMAMANMDVGRDSLLYAKFITDVSDRKMK